MKKEFSREMGFTRDEFFRLLPNAINGRTFRQDGVGVVVDVPPGHVRIDVGSQQYRKIASFKLPYIKVDFAFEQISDDEQERFMRYFELRYQRGGG